MKKIRSAITAIAAALPNDVLTNDDLSKMVDTSDEWIMQRIGIKERRILKDRNKGASELGAEAVLNLFKKTGLGPDDIELLVCATITPDYPLPATANVISDKVGIKNAWSFDISAACSGYLYALEVASKFVESGEYKRVLLVTAEKMSAITNYADRTTCPLFGDAGTATLLEPTTEEVGLMDYILRTDGMGYKHLLIKAGGSANPTSLETLARGEHYLYQEGQTVFKYAVSRMADVSLEIMERNKLTPEDIAYLVPHQANMRIIDATAKRMELTPEKVMINIQRYGNTTASTIPLCLWEWEKQLKKGDNLILASFGAGFTWGAIYLKWAYDGASVGNK
ncbi:MAG: beta-ketoacyl-ACP synthase III [Bacteroidales bacterium]